MEKLIVCRHPATVKFIKAELPEFRGASVITGNATDVDIRGKDVVGVLPVSLACHAGRYRVVEIIGSPPRGAEYGLEELRAAGAQITEYRVEKVGPLPMYSPEALSQMTCGYCSYTGPAGEGWECPDCGGV